MLTFIVYYNTCQKEIYFIFDKHFHNSISLCERQQSKGCCFSVYPVKMNTIEKNQRRYSRKRNIPFDLFILYTFKTSYRWDLTFFHSFNFSLTSKSCHSKSIRFSQFFGQALKRLVTVSSMCCHTSTSALSTSYSSRVFTSLKEWDISSWGGLHA